MRSLPSRLLAAACAAVAALAAAPAAAQTPTPSSPAVAARRDSAQTFAGRPRAPSRTTPPDGDTTGYWQQRASYRIIASLDEAREVLTASGRLTYVNRSPDALASCSCTSTSTPSARARAGRPTTRARGACASRRSRAGVRVRALHAAARRSTARRSRPSTRAAPTARWCASRSRARSPPATRCAWSSRGRRARRPSRAGRAPRAQLRLRPVVPQGRRVRPRRLAAARARAGGEFYGEFGDFDVTLVLADDQVVGATGVPVEGDPGGRACRAPAPCASGPTRTASSSPGR
jgi:hypothetical protein